MSKRAAAALLAVAALAALPAAAFAGDIRGDARTKATLPVSAEPTSGLFEFRLDSDWYKVPLEAGKDYAVSSDGSYGLDFNIRDATGKVLAAGRDGDYTDAGFEFRAPASGVFFVEYKELPNPASGDTGRYLARVMSDCRADRATTCTLRVGRMQRRATAWYTDVDWYRAELKGGRRYTVQVDHDNPCIRIANAQGRVVAGGTLCGAMLTFTPRTTGTYFVVVETLNDGGSAYGLTLTTS
jgi:hypothetical protein